MIHISYTEYMAKLLGSFICFLFISTFFLSPHVIYAVDAPPPDVKFIWVGSENQFTDTERKYIADTYKIFVFNEQHAGFDYALHHEDARQLKTINPNLQVFEYFKSTIHKDAIIYGQSGYTDAYRLKDNNGIEIDFSQSTPKGCKRFGSYSDLSNPAYHQWVLDILTEWFASTPYDGVAFDTADLLHTDETPLGCGALSNKTWGELMGTARITAFNQGLQNLLKKVKTRFPNKLIIYNGIIASEIDPLRNTQLLQNSDMVLNERFCMNLDDTMKTKQEMIEDMDLMKTIANTNKKVLEKTNHPMTWDPEKVAWLGRFCYGSFLLGYEPGSSYYKYGYGYGVKSDYPVSEITENAKEINLAIGTPIGDYTIQPNDVLKRKFTNGYIYVNMETTTRNITAPITLVLMNGGIKGQTYQQGQTVTIPPQDALFLLKPALASTSTPTPTGKPGDLNGNSKVDILDYNILIADFGKTGSPGWIPADIDKNGKVDVFDYNILVGNFGK